MRKIVATIATAAALAAITAGSALAFPGLNLDRAPSIPRIPVIKPAPAPKPAPSPAAVAAAKKIVRLGVIRAQ